MLTIKKFKYNQTDLMEKSHKIRHQVFVIGQNCPEEIEWEYEEESIHYLVLKNNKAVATARYRSTENGYKLERFAVLESERKNGYGKLVLEAIINDLKNYNDLIYLHAQIQVVNFYKKFGFLKYGKKFEEAGIQHYKMILKEI
tara:strand:- start:1086 stop:1514 length:429 start_codon:yes stop_codon:yes gene_type:complete